MKTDWAWLAVCSLLLLLVYALGERCESNRVGIEALKSELGLLRKDLVKLQNLMKNDHDLDRFLRSMKNSGYSIQKK